MNVIKTLHRAIGAGLASIVLLISVTGVMLVWKKEYLWVSIPSARELPAQNVGYADLIETILSGYHANEVLFVRFYLDELSLHKVWLSGGRYAFHDQLGKQIQVWEANERFEDWLLDLHHRLLAGNTIGLNVVGLSGLLLLPLMIFGLILWWSWRRSYSFNLFPASSRLGQIRKSHAETGVTTLLPVLLVVISGVILVYPSESRFIFRDGFKEAEPPKVSIIEAHKIPSSVSWMSVFALLDGEFPEAKIRWLALPDEKSGAFSIGVQETASWDRMGRSQIKFTGEEWLKIEQRKQPSIFRLFDFFYPLHTGKLPVWYRFLLSTAGIMLAWICFLGLLTLFKRRAAKEVAAKANPRETTSRKTKQ
ncbi:MAG: PepSY domain-containing protein [Gammaproteobacteria bacterium]|nr:PepSY domain-containing protein [Gammaproteobacteria bacterium]